ncbi:hypothetical protein MAR_032813 [Mya arenaria]|uniref:Uncharacterized protein n=1 Tax=Mya arenaria TaxID=6604 RepID=A0ABY7GBC2_MYAAR|nr:hypothetical protein MAR_032813 [Mya arenaria]
MNIKINVFALDNSVFESDSPMAEAAMLLPPDVPAQPVSSESAVPVSAKPSSDAPGVLSVSQDNHAPAILSPDAVIDYLRRVNNKLNTVNKRLDALDTLEKKMDEKTGPTGALAVSPADRGGNIDTRHATTRWGQC